MIDKIVLTGSVGLDNYNDMIPKLKVCLGNMKALEIMHFTWDYPGARCTGPNEPCTYQAGQKIGQVIKEYAPELKILEVHYPFSCELMEREGQSLINTLEEIRAIQESNENLRTVTLNHHPVYLDPIKENYHNTRKLLLESQAIQAARAQNLIDEYEEKFNLKNSWQRPELLAEPNPVFSKTRFFGNSDMTQICAEDFQNMHLNGILFDYSHVWTNIKAHNYPNTINSNKELSNLRLLRNYYTQFSGNPIPPSCRSFERYMNELYNMNLEIKYIHLTDEPSPFEHKGFALLPTPKKQGIINAEKCLRRLNGQIPNGKQIGATLEISNPPIFKPEGWQAFQESYTYLSKILAEI